MPRQETPGKEAQRLADDGTHDVDENDGPPSHGFRFARPMIVIQLHDRRFYPQDRAPNSQLILHAPPGSHRERVLAPMRQNAVDPDRVRFIPKQPLADYLPTFGQIDIVLDPFPYRGGTTTCHALGWVRR